MPVEIRELVIKTEIVSQDGASDLPLSNEKLQVLKQQIVQECMKQLRTKQRRRAQDR